MLLFLDTETGGLDIENSLLSVGLIITDDQFNVIETLHERLIPDDGIYKVTPKAMEINKIDLVEHTKTAISYTEFKTKLNEVLNNFYEKYKQQLIVVGKNVDFDTNFIFTYIMPKTKWETFVSHRKIDISSIIQLMKIAKILPPTTKANLEGICNYYNIKIDTIHEALADCFLTLNVLKEIKNHLCKNFPEISLVEEIETPSNPKYM